MDAQTVTALLASVGVDVTRIRKIALTTGAWLRPGPGQQWTVILDRAGGLAGVDWSRFADVIADGAILIVRVKEG